MSRLLALAVVAAVTAPFFPHKAPTPAASVNWPSSYEGRTLAPVAPAPEDARLARDFPGRIARFTDGRRQIVLRSVSTATRQLHPARDCFQAIGYRITPLPMEATPAGLASCFGAERAGVKLRLCERITDARGTSFPDASGWYWSALLGQSHGPWLAATIVERVR